MPAPYPQSPFASWLEAHLAGLLSEGLASAVLAVVVATAVALTYGLLVHGNATPGAKAKA